MSNLTMDDIMNEVFGDDYDYDYSHEGEEPIFCIEVDFDEYLDLDDVLLNEVNIDIPGLGKCNIMVYKDELKNEPHVHILSKNPIIIGGKKRKFNACVKLCKAEYYDHKDHLDTFRILGKKKGKKAAECLDKHMSSKSKNKDKTMWDVYRDMWLSNQPDVRNLANMKKPNYKKLEKGDDE